MVKWCFVLRKDIKKAATKFVTACYSSWTSQGLNLGPPDYESVAEHDKSCGFIVCNQLSNKSFKAFAYQLMNSYKNVSVNQR